jgi:hypothetical protein
LNVAVEVSWLSTCLHSVRFFGESNTWEHLNTQTQHMATVIHGSDTFLEPVWQCMNLKARLETKTYVRLNSSWHHPESRHSFAISPFLRTPPRHFFSNSR